MTSNKQQTALQQLKSTIKDGIGNMNGQLNDYKSGYKQCLIDIENLIDKQLLEMEKEQMWEYIKKNYCIGHKSLEFHRLEFEQYYNETYGGGNK
jgi:hypothetical protein